MLGILIGAVKYEKLTAPIHCLLILLILTFISEAFGRVFGREIKTSYPLYHLFVIIRYIMIAIIYTHYIKWIVLKKILVPSGIVILLVGLLYVLPPKNLNTFPSSQILFTNLIINFLALFSLAEMIKQTTNQLILKQSLFWFNVGNLIFCSGTFISLGLINGFLENKSFWDAVNLWGNILLYLFYVLAIFFDKKYLSV